jgi:hypothetical protein
MRRQPNRMFAKVLLLHFLSFKAESQQSHPSQQCPPVSPMDIQSAKKK